MNRPSFGPLHMQYLHPPSSNAARSLEISSSEKGDENENEGGDSTGDSMLDVLTIMKRRPNDYTNVSTSYR